MKQPLKPANDDALVFTPSCGNVFKDLDLPDWQFQTKLAERRMRSRKKKES